MKKILIVSMIAIMMLQGCGQSSGGQTVTMTASEYDELKAAAEAKSETAAEEAASEPEETPEATPEATPEPTPEETPEPTEAPEEEKKVDDSGLSAEERNALASAQNYLSFTAFSRQGLIDQLSSEYGDKYPVEAATKAVDFLEENNMVDWNEQAYAQAKQYLELSSFSLQQLIEQLASEYGGQFTQEQAEYGANKAYEEQ